MKCKYCNSENLILEQRSKETNDILKANTVALRCNDCGKFLKWCPKTERHLYINNKKSVIDKEKELEKQIRKQVCDEIRNLAHNYFELVICDKCGNTTDNDCYISSKAFYGILKQVEKGDI